LGDDGSRQLLVEAPREGDGQLLALVFAAAGRVLRLALATGGKVLIIGKTLG
jgi:hypothetical protein